jgi:hypothetical protein
VVIQLFRLDTQGCNNTLAARDGMAWYYPIIAGSTWRRKKEEWVACEGLTRPNLPGIV